MSECVSICECSVVGMKGSTQIARSNEELQEKVVLLCEIEFEYKLRYRVV